MQGIALGNWTAPAAAAALVFGCGAAEPAGEASLDGRATKSEISQLAGAEPVRCVFSAPGLELCSWRVDMGDPAWASLASGDGAGDLNLVCELPIDGKPRSPDSCGAHPRLEHAAAEASLPPVGAAGALERRREAERELGGALTLRDLSHLVGDAPDRCKTGLGTQTCEWSLPEGAAGYRLDRK